MCLTLRQIIGYLFKKRFYFLVRIRFILNELLPLTFYADSIDKVNYKKRRDRIPKVLYYLDSKHRGILFTLIDILLIFLELLRNFVQAYARANMSSDFSFLSKLSCVEKRYQNWKQKSLNLSILWTI